LIFWQRAKVIELDWFDLFLTLVLLGLAIGLSLWQRLRLAGPMVVAVARSLLQLVVLGYVVAFVFALNSPWAVVVLILMLLTLATLAIRNRISPQKSVVPILWGALFTSTVLTLAYAILVVIQPLVWYDPQYLIPLAGVLIANSMNSAAVAGEQLAKTMKHNRLEIETHLSLGASPQQVTQEYRREAILAGFTPILSSLMVIALVTLPSFFSGELLGGVDPLNAVSYQILLVLLQVFSSLLTTVLVTQGIYRQYFNENWQLLD
jgi:putative ABC transport system permease protein